MTYSKPDWHARHAELWLDVIPRLLPDRPIRWLEIGSLEGRSAAWTLQHLLQDGDELVCVDTWPHKPTESAFDANLAGKATKYKGRSVDYLATDCGTFDGIYVDGSHDAPDVLSDAVLAWRHLRSGGVMIFDDYTWRHPASDVGRVRPGVAIDGFLAAFVTRLSVLHIGEQVIIRKRRQ